MKVYNKIGRLEKKRRAKARKLKMRRVYQNKINQLRLKNT